jgi:GNAT superfamily N-acetyltransferase
VTDEVTFGWLADVTVLPDHRGRGLGKALVESVVEDAELAEVERMVLGTRDALGCTNAVSPSCPARQWT